MNPTKDLPQTTQNEYTKRLSIKNIFIIFLSLISYNLLAQGGSPEVIDSLTVRAEALSGKEKLETLTELGRMEFVTPNLLSRAQDIEYEAKKQKDSHYLLTAYTYKMGYYFRMYNPDSINHYIKLSEPIVRILPFTDKAVNRYEYNKSLSYLIRGLYDLALISQKRHLERVEQAGDVDPKIHLGIYMNLGNTYYLMEKYGEAQKKFKEALKYSRLSKNEKQNEIAILSLIAYSSNQSNNHEEAIQYNDSIRQILNKFGTTFSPEFVSTQKAIADILDIQISLGLKDLKKAKELIKNFSQESDDKIKESLKPDYNKILASYFSATHEYDKALDYIEQNIDQYGAEQRIFVLPPYFKEKASLLYDKQKYKLAYDELLKATNLVDSIKDSHSAIQLDELATIYELNLKEAEIARTRTQLKFSQTIVIALIVVAILLLTIALIIRNNFAKQKTKNNVLFKQQEELSKNINYYKKMIIDKANTNSININPLFQQLEEYMLKEEAYKDPNINREALASTLGTNRQYLGSAIKEETGLTFTGYINRYRLENARKLLLENKDISIDDIIVECGYSSRSTFHRLFKEYYGMAPHELKLASISLQKEIIEEEMDDL